MQPIFQTSKISPAHNFGHNRVYTAVCRYSNSSSMDRTYQGGAVSATPTSAGAALVTPVVTLPAGDPGRTPRGHTLPSTGVGGKRRSDTGGDGVLLSVVSRARIIGGGATRGLTVSSVKTFLHCAQKKNTVTPTFVFLHNS